MELPTNMSKALPSKHIFPTDTDQCLLLSTLKLLCLLLTESWEVYQGINEILLEMKLIVILGSG